MTPRCRKDCKEALRQLRGARHSLAMARTSPSCPQWVLTATVELAEAEARLVEKLGAEEETQRATEPNGVEGAAGSVMPRPSHFSTEATNNG